MKTIVYYDKNSPDSMLACLAYSAYLGWSQIVTDVFVPYDGTLGAPVTVDSATAAAYDRYIFLELPPDAPSLALLLTNGKEVDLFAYVAPTNWQQSVGANIIPMAGSTTIASCFLNWLLTVVDSSSFYTYMSNGLPQQINNWEAYANTYLASYMQTGYLQAAQYAQYLIFTGLDTPNQDLQAQFIGFLANLYAIEQASLAYAKSYAKAVDDTVSGTAYAIYRLPVARESVPVVDRAVTQNFLSAYVEDPNTFVEYFEVVTDPISGLPVASVTLKPIGFLASPLLYRDGQSLADLVGVDAQAAVAALMADYYATLGGGESQVTGLVQYWDGTWRFQLPLDLYFS